MTIEEATEKYGPLEDFYKENEEDSTFWTSPIERKGIFLFSFDKKKIYSFFSDFPDKLSDNEIMIFCKDNIYLVNHFVCLKKKVEDRGIVL